MLVCFCRAVPILDKALPLSANFDRMGAILPARATLDLAAGVAKSAISPCRAELTCCCNDSGLLVPMLIEECVVVACCCNDAGPPLPMPVAVPVLIGVCVVVIGDDDDFGGANASTMAGHEHSSASGTSILFVILSRVLR